MTEGVKFDHDKDPWHLAPWDAFRAVVKVLAFGAKKYTKRYETKWHGLLSAPLVKSVEVLTPLGNVVRVTKDTSGRLILSSQNANGKIDVLGESETPTASNYTKSVVALAQKLESAMNEADGSRVSKVSASRNSRTKTPPPKAVPSAEPIASFTLTIAMTLDVLEASSVAAATTALECLETVWKDLSGRSRIFAAYSLDIAQQGERNWENGMAWSRPFAALIRHLTAWWEGDSKDPETGYSHLWHAGCCIAFLISYEIRGVGTDDRPNPEPNKDTSHG